MTDFWTAKFVKQKDIPVLDCDGLELSHPQVSTLYIGQQSSAVIILTLTSNSYRQTIINRSMAHADLIIIKMNKAFVEAILRCQGPDYKSKLELHFDSIKNRAKNQATANTNWNPATLEVFDKHIPSLQAYYDEQKCIRYINEIGGLFRRPLLRDMDEDELLKIFREVRVAGVLDE